MRRIHTWVILLGVLFLVLVIVAIIIIHESMKALVVKEFSVSDYEWELQTYPSNKNVGSVDTADRAVDVAKNLWLEEFGMINGQSYDPLKGIAIRISFDSENQCWLIYGDLPSNVDGAVPHALIETSGRVLAVWMG